MPRLVHLSAATAAMVMTIADVTEGLEASGPGDGHEPGKRRYKAGPHPIIHDEPKREDYLSRQAWRADHRRWEGQH